MSYCVNCGVELGKGLKCCPLCGTVVVNPNEEETEPELPFFPTRNEDVKPVSKKELALLLSAMFASVALCCALLNLVLHREIAWSSYAAGAMIMFWIWFVPPLIWRSLPGWGRFSMDTGAIAFYVLLIALASNGMYWYLRLALPIIISAAVIGSVICWILRGGRHSKLVSIVICTLGVGLMSVSVEMILDTFIAQQWSPSWSLIVFAVCFGLIVPLLIVRFVPSLREEARRRFHL